MQRKDFKDFAQGETKSGIKLEGTEGEIDLPMDEAVSMYMAMKTLGGPGSLRVQELKGFAVKDGKKTSFVEIKDMRRLYGQLKDAVEGSETASAYIEAWNEMAAGIAKEAQDVSLRVDGAERHMFGKGRYFPISYRTRNGGNPTWDGDGYGFYPGGEGHMQERTRQNGGYVSIAPVTTVTESYINQMSDFVGNHEISSMLSMMEKMHTYGISGLSRSANDSMGSTYGAWVKNYISDMTKLDAGRAEPEDNFARDATRNWQTAVLTLNPSTPLKQMGSVYNAMGELDPRAVAKAAFTFNREISAEARENPLIRYRAKGNIDATIADAIKSQKTVMGRLAAKSGFFKAIQNWIPAVDVAECRKVYAAAYYDMQMKNPGISTGSAEFEAKVNETFQRAILHTQAQYEMSLRDATARGNSDLMKALTMFQTQQRVNFNQWLTAAGEAKAAKGTAQEAEAKTKLREVIAGNIASNVALGLMTTAGNFVLHRLNPFRRDEDEDEEQHLDIGKIAMRTGLSAAGGVAGTAMFGEDVLNLLVSIATRGDEPFYENGVGIIGVLGDIASSSVKLAENPGADSIRQFTGNVANVLGIPLNNAYKIVNSIVMYADDVVQTAQGRDATAKNSAARMAGGTKALLYGISNASTDDILKAVDRIRKAIDGFAPEEFTFEDKDGEETVYALSGEEREQYRKKAEETYTGLEALLNTTGFREAPKKVQKGALDDILSYAKNAAKQEYAKSKSIEADSTAKWMDSVAGRDAAKFIMAKNTIKTMYKNGKLNDYAAMDAYLKDQLTGYPALSSDTKQAAGNIFPRINGLYAAANKGVNARTWAKAYDKYKELTDAKREGYSATDKATDFAAYVDSLKLGSEAAKELKSQFRFYSQIPGEPTRYDRLVDAGYSPEEANNLYWRLDGMDANGNGAVSQQEAYERLSGMDDLTDEERNTLWGIINSGWKTQYTQYRPKG